jgi:hypothetical protein
LTSASWISVTYSSAALQARFTIWGKHLRTIIS